MKYIILLFLFSNLFSNEFKLEIKDTNEYILADVHFKTKDYTKAYDAYYALFEKYPTNIDINYFLSLSAMQIKNYSASMGAIERVLIQKPNLFKARFQQAKLLYYVNMQDTALIELKKLQKLSLTKKENKLTQDYIDLIYKKKKTFFLTGTFLLALSASDNVNNGVKEKYFLPEYFGQLQQGEDKKSDFANVQLVNFDLINTLKKNDKISFKNTFTFYNKKYNKENSNDFRLYAYKPSVNFYTKEASIITAEASINHYIPGEDEEDIFNSLTFNLKYKKNNYSIETLMSRYIYKEEINKDKNFTQYQIKYFLNNLFNLSYNLTLTKDYKYKSTRVDIDKYSIKNSFSYKILFNKKNNLRLIYLNSFTKYKENSPAFFSKRKDNTNDFKLSYTKIINKKNIIILNLSHWDNNSNQEEYTYNKNNLDIAYIYRFFI